MRNYIVDEATILIPKDFDDDTVNSLAPTEDSSSNFSFVITRDLLEPGEDLKTYTESQLKELSEDLPQFRLISKNETTIDDLPALDTKFNWLSENGLIQQRQVFLIYKEKAMVFTATASQKFSQEDESTFEIIMSSLKFGVYS